MSISQFQLDTVKEFVRRTPNWELVRATTTPYGMTYIGDTPSSGWILHLQPCDTATGHPGWWATLQREFASKPVAEMTGTFDQCVKWLEKRTAEKYVAAQRYRYLQDLLVDGRTGWKLAEREPDRWVGWRSISVLDEAYTVLVDPEGKYTGWWRAEARDAAGNIIAEINDKQEAVVWAVHDVVRTLGVVETLRECRSPQAAISLLSTLSREQLELLRLALNLDVPRDTTPLGIQRRILARALPGRFDPATLTPSGRW